MGITILAVGKIKEKFYREALAEYVKRLSRYTKFSIVEVSDEMTPDSASEAMENQIKEKEADRLMKHIKEDSYVISLEIGGRRLNSVDFSNRINNLLVSGKSDIIFVIGGSLGLHEKVTKRADFALSFSDMTFPHQLMRVILAEQIYRGFRIMHNEPYHK